MYPGDDHRGRCVVSSGNGKRAVAKAMEMIAGGSDCVDAVVAGVASQEADPSDMSVGYGGLPNEDGVVQLDSCVMHGPTHKAGSVACIENIMHPAQVALLVLRMTDHVMLVGKGATRFAVANGFKEQDLLTEKARQAWLRWKRNLNPNDDWLDDDQMDWPVEAINRRAQIAEEAQKIAGLHVEWRNGVPYTYGTINCSAVDDNGDCSSCTTTSGLSYKIPGRVGDSPIIGAGMYVDNAVGAAGATGRGEAVIQNCSGFSIVREMENGKTPTEACLAALKRIADNTKQKRLLNNKGEPNFGVTCYAVRKDGAYGSATMRGRPSFSVDEGEGPKHVPCTPLFE
jgi:N4-(beta-N-acetylglucosaminyl)-L-asparaginase